MDPHIQAFEILSDRVSNLEDNVGILLGTAQHRELRAYGEIDGQLWGISIPMRRSPGKTYAEDTPRQEYVAPAKVQHIIICVDGGYSGCFAEACPDEFVYNKTERRSYFSTEEWQLITEQRSIYSQQRWCISNTEVGITSTFNDVCEEALFRHLAREKAHFPTLAMSTVIPLCQLDEVAFVIGLSPSKKDVGVVASEALGLLVRCGVVDITECKFVHLYDCTEEQYEAWSTYCRSTRTSKKLTQLLKTHYLFEEYVS
jgi:hypothetical protein